MTEVPEATNEVPEANSGTHRGCHGASVWLIPGRRAQTSIPKTVVTFTYIHGSEANLTEFVHHLEAYLPLFRQLSAFRFLYLARVDSHFDKAKELFHSLVTIPLGSDVSAELLRYFQIRTGTLPKPKGSRAVACSQHLKSFREKPCRDSCS